MGELNSEFDSDDAGCFASDGEIECFLELDLRGADGRNGADGRCDFPLHLPANGQDGQRGEDAGPASPGLDATSARIRLSYANHDVENPVIALTGELIPADRAKQPLQLTKPIGGHGYLFLRAVGGRGGNGGRGGDGGPGAPGYPGHNATRYTSGTNGGDGGNGGDAGEPTDGEVGGNGGSIVIEVAHDETGLLMLAKGDLSGGELGFAGEKGFGGRGGPGGPGGSSYHWTETRTRTVNGKSQAYSVMRSNPGGFSGSRGYDGAPSRYTARDGRSGNEGRFCIRVQHSDGTAIQYASPYDLELTSFDIASEYTIFEPDSIASLDNLTVCNIGGMPTPPNYTIRIFLSSDEWILSEEIELTLPHSLAPEESFTFKDKGLRFRFSNVVIHEPRKQPFHLRHPVNPQAFLESGIHRPFRNFENPETTSVQFPIQLSDITALNSLAPGESTRVRYTITNIGDETFDDRLLHRSVRMGTRLLSGDVDQNQILFFDIEGLPHDLLTQEYFTAIRNLAPGESRVIESRIGVRYHSDVIAYQSLTFGVDLHAQHPKSSAAKEKYRCIDYRKETIRVSEKYCREEGSRFLLIANRKTDVKDIEKWTQLADYFGSGLDVWDVSYYGFLDLVRQIDQDKSMLQQWRGMTIIIPNNYYFTAAGRKTAFDQLAKSQFLKSAADFDICFYIVGDAKTGGAEMLENSLIPISDEKTASQLKTQKEFLKQVKRWAKFIERTGDVVGGATNDAHEFADASLGAVHEFEINKRTILFQPDAKWLEVEARRLQTKLRKTDPLHRWVIVHRYDTADTDTTWGFFKNRKVGKLEVRRSLDSTKGSAVLYEVDSIDMIGDNFITSDENKHGIFLTLKFEDKVDRFIRLVSERTFPRFKENYIDRPLTPEEIEEIGGQLIDSMLVDLYNEQYTARNARVWGPMGVRAMMPKLNYLAERSLNYGLTYRQMLENTRALPLLYELLANLRYMANHSRTIWDSALLPTAFFKRSRAVSNYMLHRVDRIVTNIFGPELHWWDKWSSAGDDYDPFGGAKKANPRGLARETANAEILAHEVKLVQSKFKLEDYLKPQQHPGLTYDPELLSESSRVIPGHVYDQLVRNEKQAEMERAKTEYAVAKQRSELLVPLETKVETAIATPQSQP